MNRVRVWLEGIGALVALFLAALTVLVPDWLEATVGVDPDRHSGAMEWLVAAGFAAVAAVLGRFALRHARLATDRG
jgi:nitrate reductase gamma subunit